jgi:uncharacterized protein YndB with AHSA1/START domain
MKVVTNSELVGTPVDVEVRFAPSSLDVRTEITLDAGRRRVFEALLHLGAWWPDRSRAAATVVLEPRVGGRLFEDCDDGCGTLLGHVSRLLMPEELAVEGSFGLDQPVHALWSVRLAAEGPQSTVLRGQFRAFGALDDEMRAAASATWNARYTALARYLAA